MFTKTKIDFFEGHSMGIFGWVVVVHFYYGVFGEEHKYTAMAFDNKKDAEKAMKLVKTTIGALGK